MLNNLYSGLNSRLLSQVCRLASGSKQFFLFSILSLCVFAVSAQTPATCGYTITSTVSYNSSTNKSTIVYTVVNPRPGNGSGTTLQDVSNFGIVLPPCIKPTDVMSNGTFGKNPSQTCESGPYLKFDFGTRGSTPTTYTLVLDGRYAEAGTTSAVIKAGRGCCVAQVKAYCKVSDCPDCTITGNPIVCNEGSNYGSTTLKVTCGAGIYTYLWRNPNGTPATNPDGTPATGAEFVVGGNKAQGFYSVDVTSASGCTRDYRYEVTFVEKPNCTISGDPVFCAPSPSDLPGRTFTANCTGEGNTFVWRDPNGNIVSTTASTTISPVTNMQGTYTLTVTTTGGCERTIPLTIIYQFGSACTTSSTTTRKGAGAMAEEAANVSVSKLTVSAGPNPFQDRVRFVIMSKVSGKATLDLYNMTGAKVKTMFQGFVEAGKEQVVEYSLKGLVKSNFIYRVQVGGEQAAGKLISVQ